MTKGEPGPDQIPGRLNGVMTMVDIGRIGVRLLPDGVMPDITELPDEYATRDRVRSQFDFGNYIPLAEGLGRIARGNAGGYQQLG